MRPIRLTSLLSGRIRTLFCTACRCRGTWLAGSLTRYLVDHVVALQLHRSLEQV